MSSSDTQQLDDNIVKILAVKALMRERENARKNSDFTKSDNIRDKLLSEFGVEIFDQKTGPSGWKFKDGSSKKLKAGMTLPPEITATLKRSRDHDGDDQQQQGNKNKSDKKQKVAEQPKPKAKEPVQSAEQSRNAALMNTVVQSNSSVQNKQGVLIEELAVGTGKQVATSGKRVKVHYAGRLKSNNKLFDSSKKPFVFRLGRSEVIKGWDIGVEGMIVGGKRKLTIPPEKAYGRQGAPPTIPSNATLVFEVTLLEVL